MALDTEEEITHDLAPVLRTVGNRYRLEILHVLAHGAASIGGIASRVGLSRRAAGRHLSALQDLGLVKATPSAGNGRLYAVDRQRATVLNAAFVSLMARASSAGAASSAEPALLPEDALPLVAPDPPDRCTQCQNASFVHDVLNDLDLSLARARQYQARLRQMSSQVLTAQEEERKRIARELHDDTAQALTSVLVRLRLLERSAAADDPLQAKLTELRDLTGATLAGVRRLAIDLRPPMLDDLGLEAALQAHIEDFSRRWPIEAAFTSSRLGRLPPEVELVLYRIVQEALTNVAKHASASRVEARLTRKGRTLRMLIEDDGRGFDVNATKGSRESGLGLFGMEERLALVGGTLRVESSVGSGTRISAEVPLPRSRR